MRVFRTNVRMVLVFILMAFVAMTGEGYSQQGCKQVCVGEAVQCTKYGTKCAQYSNQCAQYRNQCASYNRYGGCNRYQQVCAQYRQVCQQQQQVCLQQQKTCKRYDTVCPSSKPVGTPGKALEQLKEIEKGRDSLFDGGPGSTLNRR